MELCNPYLGFVECVVCHLRAVSSCIRVDRKRVTQKPVEWLESTASSSTPSFCGLRRLGPSFQKKLVDTLVDHELIMAQPLPAYPEIIKK